MTESIFDGTMDTVFDAIAEANLMDSDLLLLLRSMLGQRNASEICNLTKEQLRLELWLRTDDKIGDFSTEEAAELLQAATSYLTDSDAMARADSSRVRTIKLDSRDQPVDPSVDVGPRQIVVSLQAEKFTSTSGDICLAGRYVQSARSTSGDILISNSVVEQVSCTSGDITLDNVVLFGSCRTTSGDVKGAFYLAPGATVQTTSGDIKARYIQLSGEEVKNLVHFRKPVSSGRDK